MDANGGNNRNSVHANLQGLNHKARQVPYSGVDGPIACRVCGDILINRSALLDHVDHHLVLDEDGARLKVFLSHLTPLKRSLHDNLVIQNRSLPAEMNPFFVRTNAGSFGLQPPAVAASPPGPISLGLGANNSMAPLIVARQPMAPAGATGHTAFVPVQLPQQLFFTRPFLHQLEATLIMEGMGTSIDRALAARFGDDQQMSNVDLTSKL